MIMDHLSLKQWKIINRHTITMMGFGICFNGRYHWRILFKICVFTFILLVSEITELRELLLSCYFTMALLYLCDKNACCLSVFGCFLRTFCFFGGSMWRNFNMVGCFAFLSTFRGRFVAFHLINLSSQYPMECLHILKSITNRPKVDPMNIQCLGLEW